MILATFKSEEAADKVFRMLMKLIDDWQYVTVSEALSLTGGEATLRDQDRGWTDRTQFLLRKSAEECLIEVTSKPKMLFG